MCVETECEHQLLVQDCDALQETAAPASCLPGILHLARRTFQRFILSLLSKHVCINAAEVQCPGNIKDF